MNQPESASKPQTVRVTLDVVAGPHTGAHFEFQRHDTFLVGRGTWSHLCLAQDLHFSRHHFRIEIRPPDCYLIDLGSRNGTFVNGSRVNAIFLRNGDVISGGKTEIRVSVGEVKVTVPASASTVLGKISSMATIGTKSQDAARSRFTNVREIPGYELQEELGGGAMGVVYRAVHTATGQAAAIKLISQSKSASEHAIQLFVREASLLGRLDHPHIVRCLDFGYASGQLFLVMEYVPAIALDDVLANESKSSQIRIPCAIACQLLQALGHAHRLSIVHRDIKPENVLLCRKEHKLNAKLADFGLAKNYAYAGLSEISREGDIRGTIAYMPPELIVDCRNARPAGDIYSLGATLYYYLTRAFPFEFGNRNKLSVVLEDDPIPVHVRAPSVPQKLSEIVHRAMAKEAGDRFGSAREMFNALKPFATRRRRRH
jgi:serine/threonine-protein kinase